MNRRLILALTSAVLAPAVLATAAHAQPAGGHPPGAPPMAQMKAMHEAMMKQHVEDLKIVLRLRPDQEPALAAFMAAHGPKRIERRGPGDGAGPMHGPPKAQTTPQRLEEMAKREAATASEHEKHRQALARFYAALNPEQQKVFDAVQRLQKGPHGGHGGPGTRRVVLRGGPGGHGGHGGPMMIHRAPH